MLTNFHLPRTSLLLLVCAFAGRGAGAGGVPARGAREIPVLFVRRLHADCVSAVLRSGSRRLPHSYVSTGAGFAAAVRCRTRFIRLTAIR